MLILFFITSKAEAAGGDILSISATPSTFSAAGQTITFTYVFQSDTTGRNTTGASLVQSTVFPAAAAASPKSLSCVGTVPAYLNLPLTCAASYTTTQADVNAGGIQELAQGGIQVSSLAGSSFVAGSAGAASNTVSLSAAALLPQVIIFANPGPQLLNTGSMVLNATASSHLAVSYQSLDASVCVAVSGNVTFVSTGLCLIVAAQPGNGTFAAALNVVQSFTVGKANQTISFAPLPDRFDNSGTFTVSATASSGFSVSFSSGTPAICSVSSTTVLLVGDGNCTIRATQSGNLFYNAAPDVTQSFAVTSPAKTSQTITFAALADRAYGSGSFTVSASATSGLSVTFASDTPGTCGVNGNTISLLAQGACSIRTMQAGDAAYNAAADVVQSFTITAPPPQSQTITFNPIGNHGLAEGSLQVSASASSGLPVSFSSDTATVCAVSSTTVFLLTTGTCTLRASQSGASGFSAAVDVTQGFQVTPASRASQTVTFNPIPDQNLGNGTVNVSASASSGLAVSYSSMTLSTCTLSGNIASLLATGTCTIQASQPGNATYNAASATDSFAITGQGNTIFIASIPNTPINGGPVHVSPSSTSGGTVTGISNSPAVCTITGNTIALLQVGACDLTFTEAANGNYQTATPAHVLFQVTKATSGIQMSVSPSPVMMGRLATFHAVVSGLHPTGSVTFWNNSHQIGSTPLVNGVADFSFMPAQTGNDVYTALYAGDSDNAAVSTNLTVATQRPNPVVDTNVIGVVDDQVDSINRFADDNEDNIDDHFTNLHIAKRSGFSARINLNGVPIDGLIHPAADDHPLGPTLHLWTLGDIEVGQKTGSFQTDFVTRGITTGIDADVGDRLVLGLAASIGHDDTHIGTDGTRNVSNSLSLSAYADYRLASMTFLDVMGGISVASVNSDRYSSGGGAVLSGQRDARMFFASVGLTHQQTWHRATLSPYGQIKGRWFTADPYTEDGSSPWRLSYGSFDALRLKAAAGVTMSDDIPVSWGSLTARGKVEYSLQMAGGYSEGISYADDLADLGLLNSDGSLTSRGLVGVGLGFVHERVSGSLDYSYSTNGSNASSHLIQGSLGVKF